MPWKETSVMDERMKFVGRLLFGEKMAHLCREFGISRVTGHKIWNRYQQDGSRGLYNRSRAPHKHPNQLPFELVNKRRERNKYHAIGTYLSTPKDPNNLWCTDFKGQFRMGNHEYCYPLTLSDFASRFVISCEENRNHKTDSMCDEMTRRTQMWRKRYIFKAVIIFQITQFQ